MSYDIDVVNSCEYLPPIDENNANYGNNWSNKRIDCLRKMWPKMNERIDEVWRQSCSRFIDRIVDFVTNNISIVKKEIHFDKRLIPMITCTLGPNTGDHRFVYELLEDKFQDITYTSVYITANHCSDISTVVSVISDAILTKTLKETLDLNDTRAKRLPFAVLAHIYKEKIIVNNENKYCSPLLLFLANIETLDNEVVCHLMMILNEYIDFIPVILIVSTSMSWTCIQQLLPSRATDSLQIHNFGSICADQMFDEVINTSVIECEIPFKLTPRVLNFFADTFYLLDNSIESVKFLLKYALFEHFYSNPLSTLCMSTLKLSKHINKLNNDELEIFHTLLTNNSQKKFKQHLLPAIQEFQESYKTLLMQLRLFYKLVNYSNNKANKSFVKFYINVLSDSSEYEKQIYILNSFTRDKWRNSLHKCLKMDTLCDDTLPLVEVLKENYNELLELDKEPEVVLNKLDASLFKEKFSEIKTRQQLKDIVNPKNNPKIISKFEKWKQKTCDSIVNVLRNIKSPINNPLHKIFYFDDLELMKKHTICSHRSEFKNIFKNSTSTLNHKNDFYSLFTLYHESNTLINMHEWIYTFKSFNEDVKCFAKESKRKKETKDDECNDINPEIIARFLNSVSDFEYIGLLEPAKRKTDHLLRLIWF